MSSASDLKPNPTVAELLAEMRAILNLGWTFKIEKTGNVFGTAIYARIIISPPEELHDIPTVDTGDAMSNMILNPRLPFLIDLNLFEPQHFIEGLRGIREVIDIGTNRPPTPQP